MVVTVRSIVSTSYFIVARNGIVSTSSFYAARRLFSTVLDLSLPPSLFFVLTSYAFLIPLLNTIHRSYTDSPSSRDRSLKTPLIHGKFREEEMWGGRGRVARAYNADGVTRWCGKREQRERIVFRVKGFLKLETVLPC